MLNNNIRVRNCTRDTLLGTQGFLDWGCYRIFCRSLLWAMFGGFDAWGILELQELTDWPLDSRVVARGFFKQGHLERWTFCSCLKVGRIELPNIFWCLRLWVDLLSKRVKLRKWAWLCYILSPGEFFRAFCMLNTNIKCFVLAWVEMMVRNTGFL